MISRDPARFRRQASAAVDLLRRYLATPFARPNPEAVFVLGTPKTGTTVVAALLAEYGGLSATLDLWPRLRDPETLDAVHEGRLPFDRFVHRFRAEFARDLVKDPHLTLLYPQLTDHFPDARVVMTIRDPRDTIRSILNRVGAPGDLDDLGAEHYRRMRPLWEAIIKSPWLEGESGNYVETLASRWARAAGLYLDHRDDIVLVRFEDFLADKAGTIARLAAQVGVQPVGSIADKLDTPYQPPGDRAVSWREFFGPENLAALESRCRGPARALGYME